MRITCVGGGPAGLCTAIAATLATAPPTRSSCWSAIRAATTQGWGVVFWDALLDALHRHDPPSARAAARRRGRLGRPDAPVGERPPVYLGGSGYAMGRHELLAL